ncbi:MAG: VWA domain-containing protein [Alphaproteobacteria bacterium]|nr:VWA domain-containing protein [Alphaproteobacteria bacterium]
MDDAQLKKILQNIETPEPDTEAKKRAVNVSMSEFQAYQNKKEKKSQGISILSRLMGNTNSNNGRNAMERKTRKNFIYGGMATAMAVVLITGISYVQLSESEMLKDEMSLVSTAPDITAAPETDAASQEYIDAIQEVNERDVDIAQEKGSSALPIPIDPPVSVLNVPENEEPLQRWRRLSEKKLERALQNPTSSQKFTATASSPFADSAFLPPQINDIAKNTYQDQGRDKFETFEANPFKMVSEEPVSTFSADVDTASYSFMRRQLNNGVLPQKDAIRIEELINYFDYNYAVPDDQSQPFKPTVTITDSPWAEGKKLMKVGIKGYEIQGTRPSSNLVFLLDTSGSMNSADKLPLVKNSLKLMLDNMDENDTISIVVYAGSAGTVLEPTKASEKAKIIAALDRLNAGGGTAGAAGINLAYQLAEQNFDKDAVNRVILATDGDFNVGISNHEELKDFVERKRDSGIFLSVLGFGQGNYNDQMMQTLAQNGNGVAAYIDTLSEARKVLVEEASSTLFPIAKDVKIQMEFNPKAVSEYRLIGYETRALAREDFNNDKVDAGDIGAGHTVTAFYEITPVGQTASVDPLRYGDVDTNKDVEEQKANTDFGGEYAFLKMRYKLPNEDTSNLITTPITTQNEVALENADTDTRFATSVAAFGQILKGGKYTASYSYDDVIDLAKGAKGEDEFGYRAEFINLVRLAKSASDMQP